MWLNRPNPASTFFIIVLVGLMSMFVSSLWISFPTTVACHDTIELVKGQLDNASCDSGQELTYVRDFTGERYVMCSCRERDAVAEPLLPDMPSIIPPDEKVEKDDGDQEDDQEPNIDSRSSEDYVTL